MAIRFNQFGAPKEKLENVEVMTSEMKAGEVRVAIKHAPINPADINFIQGTYGVRPELPTTPGVEGSGEVLESNADGIQLGDKVIFINRVGTWQEEAVCSSELLYVVPKNLNLPSEQAAMLKVNPMTALRLLEDYADLSPGDYVVQNAANSGVGQSLIQVAKQLGLKTINLVRREGLEAGLLELGADHVLIDNADVVAKIRDICGENSPKLACNAVGGDSAFRLMNAIAEQGHHVTYGAMSLRSIKVPNKFLIFKCITLHGLWVTKWIGANDKATVDDAYTQLAEWVDAGKLTQSIDTIYPLTEIKSAVEHAMQGKKNGKVMLKMNL